MDCNLKLNKLFSECIEELKTIGINVLNNKEVGKVTIRIAPRNAKRYGCCKQEEPDFSSKYIVRRGRNRYIHYSRYKKHTIEISRWVMDLNDDIIKNTIMHEIIHCFPDCGNHGILFKNYADRINVKLGYNISRLGNKQEDYEKSNLEYMEKKYKYKIVCQNCGECFYRNRLNKNLLVKYRCGKCKGRLEVGK